jgi:hypothetical protein
MDLLVLILILLSGYIIKYLIDTINSLNNEIREIKMKCISTQNNVMFDNNSNTSSTDAANAVKSANDAKETLIKNITYFKDYFDTV